MLRGLRQAGAVASSAMAEERKRPKVQRNRHEREFLPAAVEVLETPASPVGRAVALLIACFFLIAVAWSYFGHIDTVAVAQGKVVPGFSRVAGTSIVGATLSLDLRKLCSCS